MLKGATSFMEASTTCASSRWNSAQIH